MIEQGSAEWRQQRAGKVTASRFSDAVSFTKAGKPTEARQRYMRELTFEILAGIPKHSNESKSMSWGTEVETYAREAYELETGNLVCEAEFVTHPEHGFIGASSDGWIDQDGAIEIKCPHDEAVHIDTWLDGMPREHIPQVQGNLWVTGRQWLDFISYDPRQAEPYRLYVQHIKRDDKYIAELQEGLFKFWRELQGTILLLRARVA